MPRKSVRTLVLDLDNTLFDWFAVWYASFYPIFEKIKQVSDASVAAIEADIRRVHQAQRTSEYTFLIEELDVLKDLRSQVEIRQEFKDALEQARLDRDQALRLYPTVFESLWDIKKRGTQIVAYTESMAFYSSYRLKRFGLDGVIDVLFSPEDHDVPPGVSLEKVRRLPDEFYQLQVTRSEHTPKGELKPNPKVLRDILKSIGARADTTAYVGDSLFKDVAMAREVGVLDIHAAYGESQRRPEYKLLQRVSHWTESDVQREAAIIKNGHDFEPSAVLRELFSEIFNFCDFQPFEKEGGEMTHKDETQNTIDIWKKCVEVQQHFNDLELRIRNMAITVVGALLAAMGFTYQEGLETTIHGYPIPAGLALIVAAIFAWSGFFLMDRYWYHILLKGAVSHAAKIEEAMAGTLPLLGLGTTISQESGNVKLLGVKVDSNRRLTLFYLFGFILLGVVFAFLLFAKTKVADDKVGAMSAASVSSIECTGGSKGQVVPCRVLFKLDPQRVRSGTSK